MISDYIVQAVPEVNFTKSIAKQRLIYKMTGEVVFSYIISYFLMLFYMTLAIVPILAYFNEPYMPVWPLVCCLFLIFMILSIVFRNAFVTLDIKNKQKVKEVLDTFYADLLFQVDEANILRSIKPLGHPIWGRVITVLFSNDAIYLNITTLGKGESPTFIHGLLNYYRARKIARYFNSL